MNNNYKKIFDTISQLGQLSNLSQFVNVEEFPLNKETDKFESNKNIPEESKYIYISKDDLVKLFPQLQGKLDVTNILSGLLGKLPVLKDIMPTTESASKAPKEDTTSPKESPDASQTVTLESENTKEE
ncbi:hypothetical protein JK636_09135 [Clostridium sp. YIM B02515]|uniref:Uncharacterized protein n=1 Tax=Clostridium rhizosphaerae TaxID=2803861 RepID=A0ABS1T9A5_9CLOT|nr:hypothetical protein [Clostridium rhizosphaerae]MBL4935923.1 hypothetical protein [Clostridium rhizosphaerae]